MNHFSQSVLVACLTSVLLSYGPFAAAQRNADTKTLLFSIHPHNTKYFLFRGKPLVLITGTEHYGAVQNRRVDYAKYLEDTAHKKITLTRLFLLFRELQSSRNPQVSKDRSDE